MAALVFREIMTTKGEEERRIEADEVDRIIKKIFSLLQECQLTYSEAKLILEQAGKDLGDYSIVYL